ncbi:Mov34/MPN/PAD-1 family protein [Ornithinibacillus halotolerans]|uniref:JAB domain-containing protein n=1 Tax=Ornithinibacillus halotolerans TaxID=1274357 RepID=A0A916W832_9BACI|nr:Mov34/MPN/PAD-1 family protein [Ornithinibacillus halotolerans]GGA75902.1 hypothetical protein GCM10008025_19450 [Ornithinibacillus halotolerans]
MKNSVGGVQLPRKIFNRIVEECRKSLPFESCGFLSSNKKGEICSSWNLPNESKLKGQFYVSQHSVKEVLQKIEGKKEKVTILYHSHPTAPPIPSRVDVKHHPDETVSMLILSFMDDRLEFKCYQIIGNYYKEIPVQLI